MRKSRVFGHISQDVVRKCEVCYIKETTAVWEDTEFWMKHCMAVKRKIRDFYEKNSCFKFNPAGDSLQSVFIIHLDKLICIWWIMEL